MFELNINEVNYQFNFGMGFLREVNKTVTKPIDGVKDVKQNVGLQFKVAGLLDGDPEALVDILDAANKGQTPRVTRDKLDSYIDDENTDIDALFAEVLGFLRNANATRKAVTALVEMVEKEKTKTAN